MDATWEQVHAGDVVRGYDGRLFGVADIQQGHPAGPIVTLIDAGVRLATAQPPPGTPIELVQRVDTAAEAEAFAVLASAGLNPILIGEIYQ